MRIHSEILSLDTNEQIEIVNLTPKIKSIAASSGITNGFAVITSKHTTTALFVNEFEERLLEDIKAFFQNLVPESNKYLHNDIHLRNCPPDEPENAHSHIIAMLLSNSEIIPLIDSELAIGQWQSIMFAELDGPRKRSVQIQIMGDNV